VYSLAVNNKVTVAEANRRLSGDNAVLRVAIEELSGQLLRSRDAEQQAAAATQTLAQEYQRAVEKLSSAAKG
jgi:MoxR-like ATPase